MEQARKKIRGSMESGNGQFTPIDQSRLDVFGSEMEARRVAVESTALTLLDALKAAVGLPQSADFDIVDTALEMPAPTSLDADTASQEALLRRPEIGELRAGEAARSALVRSARADLYPQFFAAGLFRYGWAPNRTIPRNPFIHDDFNFLQGGVAIGFRYSFNFATTAAKVHEAEAQRERLRAEGRLAQRAISLEARKAATALGAAQSTAEVRQRAARISRNWLAAAESNFSLGIGETRDLVDAFRAYVQTRGGLLQAIHDEKVAEAELAYATGSH